MGIKRLTRKEKIKQGIEKPYRGRRKRLMKERLKQEKAAKVFASLRDFPYSHRKMKKIVEVVRGERLDRAIAILTLLPKKGALPVKKLLLSAYASWEEKRGSTDMDQIVVSRLYVTPGPMLKRIRPAPFGRAHPIRKRRCHVFVELDWLDQDHEKQEIS